MVLEVRVASATSQHVRLDTKHDPAADPSATLSCCESSFTVVDEDANGFTAFHLFQPSCCVDCSMFCGSSEQFVLEVHCLLKQH